MTADSRNGGHRAALASATILALSLAGVVWKLRVDGPPVEPARSARPSRVEPRIPEPEEASSPIRPIPTNDDLDPRKVALGERLFHERGLSRNGRVSCATCHDLGEGGDDGAPVSVGADGTVGTMNSPTVFNSRFNSSQFWDGRAKTLEEQIDSPLEHAGEMGLGWEGVLAFLRGSEDYTAAFREAYGGPPGRDSVRDAIATFERSLISPNGAFDRYLRGDEDALSDEALAGYELFVSIGCTSCHQGVNVGGNMFQPFGTMGNPFAGEVEGESARVHLGRFNVTGRERDRHVFRVPSLRNVELTAPYFHDGSAATLEEAVRQMSLYQLGRELTDEETRRLVAFLESLTGTSPYWSR